MADRKPIKPFRKGDHLKASDMEIIRERLERQRINPSASNGIDIQESESGTSLRIKFPGCGYYGVANGNISARSGTTLGTGNMTVHYSQGGTDKSQSVDLAVLNPSSNTMGAGEGISSGRYCFAQPDAYGNMIVAPLEC